MEITPFDKVGEASGVSLIGKLCTLNDYQLLRNYFNNISIKGSYVIIDLTRLTFTSSHGLGLFLGIANKLKTTEKELLLFNPREEIQSVLTLAGIDKRIRVAYSCDELRHIFKEGGKEL
jgi:anti-anti-sigma factor